MEKNTNQIFRTETLIQSIHICMLLIFFVHLNLAYAENIQDYYKPYVKISFDKQVYSWTDKVHITIDAPSWNENKYGIDSIGDIPGYAVKISTGSHNLEPYKLVETDPNSGIFTGEVTLSGFFHDADGNGKNDVRPLTGGSGPTGGFLEAKQDDSITISFEFADGVVITKSAHIGWQEAKISFDKQAYVVRDTAFIQIIDPDMNLNPETSDTFSVEVSSDSDKAGIEIDAIESNQDSGIFVAKLLFTETDRSSGSRLFAKINDVIYAKYEDHTLPFPYNTNDDLDIVAKSLFTPNISHSDDKIRIEDVFLSDTTGNKISTPIMEQQLQITGKIQNMQNYNQVFTCIVQITNKNEIISQLSWFSGTIAVNQKFDVALSWTPSSSGNYTIRTFVWKSLDDAEALAKVSTTTFRILQ